MRRQDVGPTVAGAARGDDDRGAADLAGRGGAYRHAEEGSQIGAVGGGAVAVGGTSVVLPLMSGAPARPHVWTLTRRVPDNSEHVSVGCAR